jgi:hypothetical protein
MYRELPFFSRRRLSKHDAHRAVLPKWAVHARSAEAGRNTMAPVRSEHHLDSPPSRRVVIGCKYLRSLVDLVGFEPTTSSMPWKKRPSSCNMSVENKALLSVGSAGKVRDLRDS